MFRFASTVMARAALMTVPKVAMSVFVVLTTDPGAVVGLQLVPRAQAPSELTFQVALWAERGRSDSATVATTDAHSRRRARREGMGIPDRRLMMWA